MVPLPRLQGARLDELQAVQAPPSPLPNASARALAEVVADMLLRLENAAMAPVGGTAGASGPSAEALLDCAGRVGRAVEACLAAL